MAPISKLTFQSDDLQSSAHYRRISDANTLTMYLKKNGQEKNANNKTKTRGYSTIAI
jgi:hypothetical protein